MPLKKKKSNINSILKHVISNRSVYQILGIKYQKCFKIDKKYYCNYTRIIRAVFWFIYIFVKNNRNIDEYDLHYLTLQINMGLFHVALYIKNMDKDVINAALLNQEFNWPLAIKGWFKVKILTRNWNVDVQKLFIISCHIKWRSFVSGAAKNYTPTRDRFHFSWLPIPFKGS